ncbi:protein kinase [Streptomyces sp. NPDC058405]|uniref:serine/threonine-protein kinase n=1 Tax=Streptomyces sp. NPDC058405 TaxID=3346482 RepID=UPI0036508E17
MEKLAAGDPQRIGTYQLLARLGAGGMGRVYLARSDRGRTVAVKLVRQELAEQEQFRSRFRQEVAAARRVGGSWTAPVLDADTEAAVPWLATGYVAGPSLQSVVSGGHGPLPERSVRILASGLAHALQDIHAAGLIHRDLKPSNVLVTIDGPRVIDFGIARALETVTDGGLTRTGALVGSPGFMAPEQVRGDRVTAACDVFCLGSVLAYAATGRLPFGAADTGAHALIFRIAQEEPDLSELPEGLAELVRCCLLKDPAARPTTKDILARVGEASDSGAGPGGEPWLPGGLLAQLGQHAVRLLEHEDPTGQLRTAGVAAIEPAPAVAGPAGPTPEAAGPAAPAPTGDQAPAATPAPPPAAAAASSPTPAPAPAPAPAAAPAPAPAPLPGPAPFPVPLQTPALPPAYSQAPVPQPYGYPPAGYGPTPPHGPTPPPGASPQYGPSPQYNAPFGPTPPYGPAPVPPPPQRNARGTIALIAVAVIVAIGAGGSVYAFMGSDGTKDDKGTGVTDTTTPKPPVDAPSASTTPSGAPSTAEKGDVPTKYLGTWTGGVDTSSGYSTRRLVIEQGEVGDTVLSLTADGPAGGGGSYHCVFEAPLASSPASDAPLSIGPSEVTTGEPMSSCTPGTPTELTILSDGSLRRVTTNGESLTYKKED